MMAIENIIDHIATSLKKDSAEIRRRNFYQKKKKNITHYNMKIEDNVMQEIFDQLIKSSNYKSRQLRIKKFNAEIVYQKNLYKIQTKELNLYCFQLNPQFYKMVLLFPRFLDNLVKIT